MRLRLNYIIVSARYSMQYIDNCVYLVCCVFIFFMECFLSLRSTNKYAKNVLLDIRMGNFYLSVFNFVNSRIHSNEYPQTMDINIFNATHQRQSDLDYFISNKNK